MAANATTSPLATIKYGAASVAPQLEYVIDYVSNASTLSILATILATLVVYDQFRYILNKGSIAGPAWKMPFIGPFLQSMNPKFEEYYAKWLSGPLSCVSVFHKFVVIASTRDMARKVFNSPAFVKPCVVDVAHKLLGADNWVFLDGKAHVEFRKGLNGLFTRRALEIYLPGQEEVYNRYFKEFVATTKQAGGEPVPFMTHFREVITAVSCRTFVGHYITDEAVKKIADDYYLITAALELVNFPIILPYTKTWYGKKAADMVLAEFAKCAAKSKARMAAGGEPNCIMDAWIIQMIQSQRWRDAQAKGDTEGVEKPTHILRDFTDYEISQTVFTFLFASQDATSSAATWLFQIMAQRPDVLDRVREENLKARNGDINAAVDMDQLEGMTYTRAVVRELLRYRPPVLMVPYVVKKPFPITETYTAPKGSMVIPTTYMALRDPEVYDRPDEFDPERYYTGDAEVKGMKNYLVFGTGPHYCLGQQYAQLNLVLMVGKASLLLDWKHHATPKSEEIKVFATIFPMTHNCKPGQGFRPFSEDSDASAPSNSGYDAVVDVDDEGDLGHTDLQEDLEFHNSNFSENSPALGTGSARGGGPGGHKSPSLPLPATANTSSSSSQPGGGKRTLWTMSFYAQFFDVDTSSVLHRCWAALYPRANFLDVLDGNPDLYGPFWIATTVVLILFLGGTISDYSAREGRGEFAYDFGLLSGAAGLIYGYTFVIPVVLYLALRYFGSESANLLECWALYGYGNLTWIPVALISWSPIAILNWVFVGVGFGVSVAFLLRNLYPVLSATDRQTSKVLLILVVALHFGLAIAIKVLFFAHGSPALKDGGDKADPAPERMMF